MTDAIIAGICLAVLISNAGLWYRMGRVEQKVKDLNGTPRFPKPYSFTG